MPTPFRVLAVCSGNVCRSPAVERLLASRLGAAYRRPPAPGGTRRLVPGVEVASAGTGAVAGMPISDHMARLLVEHGCDASGFVARQVTPGMLRQSDLVLALTAQHRSQVVRLEPHAAVRTFTVRELARLLLSLEPADLPGTGATTADRLRAIVPLAAARRRQVPPQPQDDDVLDPFLGTEATYRAAFAQLAPAVLEIAAAARR
ncbi:arsenate reductase/protein-tyrosine-phosphatase family protein [Cellulomonas soli]